MAAPDMPFLRQITSRLRADDAYSAWSNAQRRCTDALRAWHAAQPADRAMAYDIYVAALDYEEVAAAGLASLLAPSKAALAGAKPRRRAAAAEPHSAADPSERTRPPRCA